MLGVAATTATAGIIVGVVTLTGLGLKIAGLIVALAGGHAVPDRGLLGDRGLAARPRGAGDGVVHHRRRDGRAGADAGRRPRVAAHMFIFYYAVLSEVSPPTALSPFAAAAHHRRQSVRDDDADVEVHAAGVPRAVRVHAEPRGLGVLLQAPLRRRRCRASATAAVGVAALAAGFGGWIRGPATLPERGAARAGGGLLLCYAGRLGGPRRTGRYLPWCSSCTSGRPSAAGTRQTVESMS